MLSAKILATSLAFVPVTLAAVLGSHIATGSDGIVIRSPSAAKTDVIDGLPCPGLKALAIRGKFDAVIKDWSTPHITLAQASEIFEETFNLQPDFTHFTISAAAKLSPGAGGYVSLKDIRKYDSKTPIAGQIVHEACISRADPKNNPTDGILTPRPFDAATFEKYLGHLKGASTITVPIQAAARKAEVDVHKETIGPLAWFNVWAESALLLFVLGDGTGKSISAGTVTAFFKEGVLPSTRPQHKIGMPELTKLTVELIYEAYKNDLSGLVSLLERFATAGIASAFHNLGLDYHSIAHGIVQQIEADKLAMNGLATQIKGFFDRMLPQSS